ncbi:hypothetical protein EV651_101439 [Kribbella sp. VKM Ac-2571]|nr:hypothetical protein EV651_101439 [Kribbella sp. VKM Ac-2571]
MYVYYPPPAPGGRPDRWTVDIYVLSTLHTILSARGDWGR